MSRVSGTVELVRLMILRGELAAGARVVEVHVAHRFGVGRGTLREALRKLEGEGLLQADEDGGMHVVAMTEPQLTATLQLRAALEPLAARLAAVRVLDGDASPAAVRRLEPLAQAADAASGTVDVEPAVLADRNFHRAIGTLAGNAQCHDALNQVWDRLLVATARTGFRPDRDARGDDHRELAAAILAGDPGEAEALAREHARAATAA